MVLAYTLYSYYFDNESSTGYKYINLALSFLMLYFVKELGFYLGLSVFTMIIISKALAKNLTKKEFKYLIYTIIPVLLVKFSWSSLVNVWGFTDMFNTGNIVNLFKLNFLPYHIKVLENFFNALTYTSLTNSLYPISYFVILGFAILISYFLMGREKQKEKKVFIVSIVIGWLIYAAFTLVSYMFLFNEYEALKLASYTRYMSVYALAMIVFLFILCFNEGLKKPKSINKIFIVVIFIFCLGFNINNLAYLTIFTSVDKENTTYLRSQFNTMTEKVGKYVKDGEKVYFIASDTDGFEFYIAKYLLTPLRINEDSWSIGNVYDEEDVWTTYISSSDWKSILIDEYDYVYVYKTDEQFIDTYGSLFAEDTVENDQLYRINKDSSTAILELVS